MQFLLQSSFLQALAYSLIASIWQMALLWLLVFVLLKSFKFSSAQKFNIAYAAQLGGFVLFIYTCISVFEKGADKIIIGTETSGVVAAINGFANAIMPYAAILYLGILMYKLVKLSVTFNDTQKLKKHNLKKISAEQRIFVQHVSELFSIHRKVKIYLSEKVICPLTTGFFKPVILIPVAAINQLTTLQLEAVILHELAHIKRADYLLYILQSIVEKIFFFNVFSLMLSDIIEKERENACDDWVLQFRYNSMHYAEALFKLGRIKTMPAMAMPLQGKKESLLLMRVKRLLHKPQRDTFNLQPVLLGLFTLLVCSGLMISSPLKKPKEFAGLNINVKSIAPVAKAAIAEPATENIIAQKKAEKISVEQQQPSVENSYQDKPTIETGQQLAANDVEQSNDAYAKLQQEYMLNVKQALVDSLQYARQYVQAVTANVQMNAAMVQKAISYQNFKQLEAMLAASGDSINIKESESTKNSYKKLLTIESFDKQGNKHVYSVEVELYQ